MDKYEGLRFLLNATELGAAITGFCNWKKLRPSYWKWFPVYLAVIALMELLAEYIGYVLENFTLNGKIYFLFGIFLQFNFFYWLFYKTFPHRKTKRLALLCMAVYFLCWLTDIFYFGDNGFWFKSFSYTAGNVLLLLLILVFFTRLIKSDAILDYRRSMMFWVCCGLMIFYMGSLPFYGLWNTLAFQYPDVFNVYWIIQIIFDCLMYFFFILGFIWGKVK